MAVSILRARVQYINWSEIWIASLAETDLSPPRSASVLVIPYHVDRLGLILMSLTPPGGWNGILVRSAAVRSRQAPPRLTVHGRALQSFHSPPERDRERSDAEDVYSLLVHLDDQHGERLFRPNGDLRPSLDMQKSQLVDVLSTWATSILSSVNASERAKEYEQDTPQKRIRKDSASDEPIIIDLIAEEDDADAEADGHDDAAEDDDGADEIQGRDRMECIERGLSTIAPKPSKISRIEWIRQQCFPNLRR